MLAPSRGRIALAFASLCGCSSPSSEPACRGLQRLQTCATGTVLPGVDVSEFQSTVQWDQVRAAGVAFAFARISDGIAYPDPYFRTNWQGMRDSGIVRGAYQYFRAGVDPRAQANLVLASLEDAGGLHPGDLPVVMDIETEDGQDESTIVAHMRDWLASVRAATGRLPILYTSNGTYPVHAPTFAGYPLWVANYDVACPLMPEGWSGWSFWQSSSTGMVAGIGLGPVDLDEFQGTLADLMAFGADAGVSPEEGGTPDAEAAGLGGVDAQGDGRAMGQAGEVIAAIDASATSADGGAARCGP